MKWTRIFSFFIFSAYRLLEDKLNRLGLDLRDKRNRSFKDEAAFKRMTTADELLDESKSSLDSLEVKKSSSKVVNSFFETEDLLHWIEGE